MEPWRTKWQSTPVFLPGKSHGKSSLVGYSRRVVTKQKQQQMWNEPTQASPSSAS